MVLEKVIVMGFFLCLFLSFVYCNMVQKGTRGLAALIIPSYLYGVGKLLQRKDVHIVLSAASQQRPGVWALSQSRWRDLCIISINPALSACIISINPA